MVLGPDFVPTNQNMRKLSEYLRIHKDWMFPMATDSIKKYGLEFIQEMAKDRKIAQQETSAVILGTKNSILSPGRPLSFEDVETYAEITRREVIKVLDSELNRISIKTLQRIRKILSGQQSLDVKATSSNTNEERLQLLEAEKQKLQETFNVMIVEKNKDIMKQQEMVKQAINRSEKIEKLYNRDETSIKQLNAQIMSLQEQKELNISRIDENMVQLTAREKLIKTLQEEKEKKANRVNELMAQLTAKENLINSIQEQTKLQESDISSALQSVEDAYKDNEATYLQSIQQTIDQTKQTLERDHKIEVDSLKEQIERLQQDEKSIQQTKKALERDLKIEVDSLKDLIERLEQEEQSKSDSLDVEYKQKIKLLEEELEVSKSEQKDLERQKGFDMESYQQGKTGLDYIQRLLSTHPVYAAVMILMNLGGTMDLPTLAKSVGAHPLKLMHEFQNFVSKNLLTISEDDPPIVSIVST